MSRCEQQSQKNLALLFINRYFKNGMLFDKVCHCKFYEYKQR